MMRNYESDFEIMHQLTLKPILFQTNSMMGDYMKMSIKEETWRSHIRDAQFQSLRAFILGKKVEEIPKEWFEYPRDWWHAFKERFFPKWLLKRFPVENKKKVVKLEVYHLCPHINVPYRGDRSDPHITFLLTPSLWPMPNLQSSKPKANQE